MMNDDVVMIDEVDLNNQMSSPMMNNDILDNEAVSIRLLVYEDSRSILCDMPFTERNMDSDGSKKNESLLLERSQSICAPGASLSILEK